MAELITQAEHARRCGVSRKSVTIWKAEGKLTMVGALVDHGASYKGDRYAASVKAARAAEQQPAPPAKTATPQAGSAAEAPAVAAPADPVPEVTSSARAKLNEAVTRKEDYTGRLKELEYEQKAGRLIPLDVARRVFFDEARAARDVILAWPARVAALIAADLGIEDAGRVAAVLQAHTHQMLVSLAAPSHAGFDEARARSAETT